MAMRFLHTMAEWKQVYRHVPSGTSTRFRLARKAIHVFDMFEHLIRYGSVETVSLVSPVLTVREYFDSSRPVDISSLAFEKADRFVVLAAIGKAMFANIEAVYLDASAG